MDERDVPHGTTRRSATLHVFPESGPPKVYRPTPDGYVCRACGAVAAGVLEDHICKTLEAADDGT